MIWVICHGAPSYPNFSPYSISLILPLRRLNESSEVLLDAAQIERIEPSVTNHGAVKVDGSGEPRAGFGATGWVHHGVPFSGWHLVYH